MGLFSPNRRRKPLQMARYQPLEVGDRDEAMGRVAEVFWSEPVEARNEFANRVLAWGELQDASTFEAMKRLVVETESAVRVEGWRREDPEVEVDVALAELRDLLLEMVRAVAAPRATASNYHTHLGPDIPLIVGEVFVRQCRGDEPS